MGNRAVLGLGLILIGPSRLHAAPLDLVAGGRSQAVVYLHAEAGPLAAEAAADLTNVLNKMSGALLRVERAGAARDIAGDRPAILLGTLAEQAGLRAHTLKFMNLVGFFGWWVNAKVLKREEQSEGQIALFDGVIVPVMSTLEGWVEPPVGQSIFAVLEKV